MKKLLVLLALGLAVAAWRTLADRAHPTAVMGLWFDREPRDLAGEVRFYYFAKDGHGLYRYGQAGYNQTHSFDWRVEGDVLALRFRKSGERARTRFRLGEESGRRTLTLTDDPRGPGAVRYRFAPSNLDTDGPLALPAREVTSDASAVDGRMWIDFRHYATGGVGFSMYQLSQHPSAPTWRRGWFHAGDFDDWTTETLDYRVDGGSLVLRFPLRGGDGATAIQLGREGDHRLLRLERDPRNFYHRSRFVDAGPSF